MNSDVENKSIDVDNNEINIKKENFSIACDGTSSSLLNIKKYSKQKKKFGSKLNIFNGILSFTFGVLITSLGILTTIYSIFQFVMDDRLNMTPGFPPYELWFKSEPTVYCRVYLFNFTNSVEFLKGIDSKLNITEIGPIVYREYIENSNVVHHLENSTMSYTIRRYIEYLPEMNDKDILNKTIIVPNIALLSMASVVNSFSIYNPVRLVFKFMSRQDQVFLNTTINDFLWNLTTPALKKASTIDRGKIMIPVNNSGPLENIYNNKNSIDRVNVKIGKINGAKDFFKINSYNYRSYVPGYYPEKGDCPASVVNSTEGAIFGGLLSPSDIFHYFRKSVCRSVPLHFDSEVQHGPFLAYKYVAKSNIYDRTDPSTDCYKKYNEISLPDGVSDASKCYADLPITVSLPHFYDRKSDLWDNKIRGFKPSKENHTSYTIVEPTTGTPLEQCARSQSNLILPKFNGFSSDISKFSKTIIPMMWIEYHLKELTPSITIMIYITAKVLPIAQYVVPVVFLLIGIALLYIAFNKIFFVNNKKKLKSKTKDLFI